MKALTAQANAGNNALGLCRAVFYFACLFSLYSLHGYSQPTLTNKSGEKDFGSSLKRYETKSDKSGDPKAASSADDTIRVSTNLVVSDVLVVSQKGNPLVGLKKEDFIVTENGVPQEISVFSPSQDPKIGRSIVLIIGYGIMIQPYIHTGVEAAKVLIDKLGPQDRMAIVSDQLQILSGFTSNKTVLKNSLTTAEQAFWSGKRKHSFACGHFDEQYSAFLAALNELVQKDDIRPVVIFQTDGDEYPYLKPESKEWKDLDKQYAPSAKTCPDQSRWRERSFSFEDVKDAIAMTGATVYSVIPGPRVLGVPKKEIEPHIAQWWTEMHNLFPNGGRAEGSPSGIANLTRWNLQWQSALADLAGFSGGYTEFLENPKDADRIYDNIFTIMNNRFVVGYYPKDEMGDGKRRNIKIEIKGHPEYGTISRKTFLPGGTSNK
jgi:VWFA-related protein